MAGIWRLAAAIATLLLVPAPLCAQEKETDLTDTPPAPPAAPVGGQRPHATTLHGTTLTDPWHWPRDESYPVVDDADVLAYVSDENTRFEGAMKTPEGLGEILFQAINVRSQRKVESRE